MPSARQNIGKRPGARGKRPERNPRVPVSQNFQHFGCHVAASRYPSRMKTPTKRYPVELLEPADVAKILRACSRGYTGTRNRALIMVLWRCGLRISEALALRPQDIDMVRGTVTVLHGKGNKTRFTPIDADARAEVARWLERRKDLLKLKPGSPLFCTMAAEPVQTRYIRQLMPRLARIGGVEKRVHAHAFRHTNACELMREGAPMNLIQKQLGHANPSVTARYLNNVAPPELMELIQRRVLPPEVAAVLSARW